MEKLGVQTILNADWVDCAVEDDDGIVHVSITKHEFDWGQTACLVAYDKHDGVEREQVAAGIFLVSIVMRPTTKEPTCLECIAAR